MYRLALAVVLAILVNTSARAQHGPISSATEIPKSGNAINKLVEID